MPNPLTVRPPSSSLPRIIVIILLILIVLVGLAILITWLTIKPRKLIYTIEEGTIHNFNINTKNNHLNATFNLVLKSQNPNHHISIYYDYIDLSVGYDDQTVAFNTLDPFIQPLRNVTRLEAKLEARDAAMSKGMSRDLRVAKASGVVELDVWVKARVRFKVGVFKMRQRTLRMLCSPVMVSFASHKSVERTYCDIDG